MQNHRFTAFKQHLSQQKHQHDITTISSSQQLKMQPEMRRYNAHACGTNRAKPST